jgi:hypothetical protein
LAFYNFEVRTPSHVMLTEGAEMADMRAVRLQAARRIGELLKEHAGRLWVDEEWQMDVPDNRGLILYVMQVSALKTAATLASHNSDR